MPFELLNVYYQQDTEIPEYLDIYLETNKGFYRFYIVSIKPVNDIDHLQLERLKELDQLRDNIGPLSIDQIRSTYDNDTYFLLSGKALLVFEFMLDSNYRINPQVISIYSDINQAQLEEFNELDSWILPE